MPDHTEGRHDDGRCQYIVIQDRWPRRCGIIRHEHYDEHPISRDHMWTAGPMPYAESNRPVRLFSVMNGLREDAPVLDPVLITRSFQQGNDWVREHPERFTAKPKIISVVFGGWPHRFFGGRREPVVVVNPEAFPAVARDEISRLIKLDAIKVVE